MNNITNTDLYTSARRFIEKKKERSDLGKKIDALNRQLWDVEQEIETLTRQLAMTVSLDEPFAVYLVGPEAVLVRSNGSRTEIDIIKSVTRIEEENT